jgi:hypothetical protein
MHPHHSVHVQGNIPDGTADRCERLLPVLGPVHAFSHATAALIHGAPLPWRLTEAPLSVIAIGERAPLRHRGVIGRWTADGETPRRVVDGLPVIAPAEILPQLAERVPLLGLPLPHPWLVAVADFLVSGDRAPAARRIVPCTMAELADAVARHRGRRGVRAVEAALELCRVGVDSPEETFLRLALIEGGLPEPVVQLPVMTSKGLRHADLGYPEERVLLEFQGDGHRTSRARWLDDLRRVQLFEDVGYRVIAVGHGDVHPSAGALISRVRRALRGTHWYG